MNDQVTFAILACLAGVLFFLIWLYVAAGTSRSTAMLKKSILLFVVPIAVLPGRWIIAHLGLALWTACEESLKALASTLERRSMDRFLLVSLFGIWELTLVKPLWILTSPPIGLGDGLVDDIDRLFAISLPVLMHAVTASIYAFAFQRRIWCALLASWAIHMAFNGALTYFGLSIQLQVVETFLFSGTLAGILVYGIRLQTNTEFDA